MAIEEAVFGVPKHLDEEHHLNGLDFSQVPRIIRVAHVHAASDRSGVALAGTYIRVTMTDEHGVSVSMLWSDEGWRDNMVRWTELSHGPSSPDTHKE